MNHIHVGDVADAIAAVATGTGHDGRIYMITGGEALDFTETAARLSDILDRPVSFTRVSPEEARVAFAASGRPAWFVEVLLELFGAFDCGAIGVQTATFEELTGRRPRGLEALAAAKLAA